MISILRESTTVVSSIVTVTRCILRSAQNRFEGSETLPRLSSWNFPLYFLILGMRAFVSAHSRDLVNLRAITDFTLIPTIPQGASYVHGFFGGIHCEVVQPKRHRITHSLELDDWRDRRIILYLHGGGGALCSSRTHRVITHSLAVQSDSVVVVPNYRRVPEASLLHALEDALSVYHSLLDRVESKQIAFCGDSAGGTLCVLALSRIRDRELAMPSCGLLFSPWCNLREVPTVPSPVDYLTQEVIAFMIELLQGEDGLSDEQLSLADPMSVNLTGLPPLCVQLGDAELFVDQIRAFVKRCKLSDIDVVLHEYHEMVHIPHFFSFLSSEGKRAMADAASFIKNNVPPLFL